MSRHTPRTRAEGDSLVIRIGAIADDFTGGADLAVLMRRSGVSVSLLVGVPETPPAQTYDVVVIALKTRNVAPADAIAQSLAAAAWLCAEAGVERVFFKYCSTFDSTDEGNIGPVTDALMDALSVARTIAVPAFPENGRQMFQGHLFVNSRLLSESSMANHPLTPMHDPDIVRVLSRQRKGPVGLIDKTMIDAGPHAVRSAFADAPTKSILVCDVVNNDDLEVLAEAFDDLTLVTGGSALGGALAHRWAAGPIAATEPLVMTVPQNLRTLALSGSGSEMTQRQVARALERGFHGIKVSADEAQAPDVLVARVLGAIKDNASTPSIVYATDTAAKVRQTQARFGRETAGRLLEEFFGLLAKAAVDVGYRGLIVAGGETSGAVVKALGVTEMVVGPEIAPGVPWVKAGETWLALKSGNFGDEDFFETAQHLLLHPEPPMIASHDC